VAISVGREYVVIGEFDFSIDRITRHITCLECDQVWCAHLANITRENLDTEFIWGEENAELVLRQSIQVPIVPTMSMWAEVTLTLNDRLKAYMVEFDSVFIGFIHRGEGRGVLRSMMIDWFRGTDFAAKECIQIGHSYKAQMVWQRDMQPNANEGRKFSQQWSVFTTGRCLVCNGEADDFSDLAPEDDKQSRSPWPNGK
jgi:hypothetical protein